MRDFLRRLPDFKRSSAATPTRVRAVAAAVTTTGVPGTSLLRDDHVVADPKFNRVFVRAQNDDDDGHLHLIYQAAAAAAVVAALAFRPTPVRARARRLYVPAEKCPFFPLA